MGEVNYVAELL
jgi:regulator of nonsense transcripts 1